MNEKPFLSTKEVAQFLDVNEKMVYSLVSDKGLPATKITGKWLFPRRLVEQCLENHIINYPKSARIPLSHKILVMAGSHDILLERTIALFNHCYPEHLIVFGNTGSLGGIHVLQQGLCHIAASHLLQHNEQDYNFEFIRQELGEEVAAVVNFCQREQGLILAKGNPKNIQNITDLGRPDITIANRSINTGTRLLFDRELQKHGLNGPQLNGYQNELGSHWDVALEVLSGRVDAAPGIRAAAGLLDLDFLPTRWERYDLLLSKNRFFEEGVQLFLNLLREQAFQKLVEHLSGYNIQQCGQMIFSQPDCSSNQGNQEKKH